MESDKPGLNTKAKKYEFIASFHCALISFVLFHKQLSTLPAIVAAGGGGAFFIPYCLSLAIIILPGAYLEMTVGQLSGKGPIRIWEELSSIFKGLGYAKVLMLLFACIEMAPTIGYAFFYLFWGLVPSGDVLPWNTCGNSWNNGVTCRTTYVTCNSLNPSNRNGTPTPTLPGQACIPPGLVATLPEREYFRNYVLEYTTGYDGAVVVRQVACLGIVWAISFLIICSGFRIYRRVSYGLIIVIVSLILVLLGFSFGLKGSSLGWSYILSSLFFRLRDINVWYAGFREAFYTFAISSGCFVYFGSRNKVFTNTSNIWPPIVAVIFAGLYSVACSFVVYGYLGYLAEQTGRSVQSLVSSGNDLMFVTLPMITRNTGDGRLKLALSMFYSLYAILGLSTLAIMLETVVTAVVEDLPKVVHRFKIAFRIGFHAIVFGFGILTARTGSLGVIAGMELTSQLVQPFLSVFQYFAFVFVFARCLVPEVYHYKLPPRGWAKAWLTISIIVLVAMTAALIYHSIIFIPTLVSRSDTFLLSLSWSMFSISMLLYLGTALYKAIKNSKNIIKVITPSENLNVSLRSIKQSSRGVQYKNYYEEKPPQYALEEF